MTKSRAILGVSLAVAGLVAATFLTGAAEAAKAPRAATVRVGPFGLTRGKGVVVALHAAAKLGRTVPVRVRILNALTGAIMASDDWEVPVAGTAAIHALKAAADGSVTYDGNGADAAVGPSAPLPCLLEFQIPEKVAGSVRGSLQFLDLETNAYYDTEMLQLD